LARVDSCRLHDVDEDELEARHAFAAVTEDRLALVRAAAAFGLGEVREPGDDDAARLLRAFEGDGAPAAGNVPPAKLRQHLRCAPGWP
jgi:hypothetical protein